MMPRYKEQYPDTLSCTFPSKIAGVEGEFIFIEYPDQESFWLALDLLDSDPTQLRDDFYHVSHLYKTIYIPIKDSDGSKIELEFMSPTHGLSFTWLLGSDISFDTYSHLFWFDRAPKDELGYPLPVTPQFTQSVLSFASFTHYFQTVLTVAFNEGKPIEKPDLALVWIVSLLAAYPKIDRVNKPLLRTALTHIFDAIEKQNAQGSLSDKQKEGITLACRALTDYFTPGKSYILPVMGSLLGSVGIAYVMVDLLIPIPLISISTMAFAASTSAVAAFAWAGLAAVALLAVICLVIGLVKLFDGSKHTSLPDQGEEPLLTEPTDATTYQTTMAATLKLLQEQGLVTMDVANLAEQTDPASPDEMRTGELEGGGDSARPRPEITAAVEHDADVSAPKHG